MMDLVRFAKMDTCSTMELALSSIPLQIAIHITPQHKSARSALQGSLLVLTEDIVSTIIANSSLKLT